MDAAFAQQFKAGQQLGRARQRDALTRYVGNGFRIRIAHVEQITHVYEADHVVEVLAGDRIARIRLVAHEGGRLFQAHRPVDEHDVGTRAHHFGHNRFGSVEHVVKDRTLVLAQVGVGVDEHAQLIVGYLGFRFVRVEAEQTHQTVGVLANQPDERTAHLGEDVDGRHDRAGDGLVALHGDTLGHQLGDHDRAVGDDERQADGGQRRGDMVRYAPAFHDGHYEWCDGGFAERGGEEARERDADLHAGQEGVGVAGDFGDACTAGVLQFHLVDLRAAQTHQREFGAGEYRSEQQEDEDQQDVQTK